MRNSKESGQALVLVLLSLSVVLTVVLFILSRSITDVSVSSGQAESVRAFSAAEAGIERSLVTGGIGSVSTQIGEASYILDVTNLAEGSQYFNYPSPLISGDSMTTWFVAHDSNGNIVCDSENPCFTGDTMNVCWGNIGTSPNAATTPAIEISIYYESTPGDLSTIKIARAAYDPNTIRRSSNSFSEPDSGACNINGVDYAFKKTISIPSLGIGLPVCRSQNGLVLVRAKMLYNVDTAHVIATNFDSSIQNTVLPSQGRRINSTGTAGQSNRKISVFQGWPEFPFGGSTIFSPNGITK